MGVAVVFTYDGGARRFVESLDAHERTKVGGIFDSLRTTGRVENANKMKRLHSGVWELRVSQVRLLGDYRPGAFVVAHGLHKKATVLDQAEVRLAQRRLTAHDRVAA